MLLVCSSASVLMGYSLRGWWDVATKVTAGMPKHGTCQRSRRLPPWRSVLEVHEGFRLSRPRRVRAVTTFREVTNGREPGRRPVVSGQGGDLAGSLDPEALEPRGEGGGPDTEDLGRSSHARNPPACLLQRGDDVVAFVAAQLFS